MKTNSRKYTTISIPKNFEHLIPKLQKAYAENMGLNVSRGETVGIAIKNEFEKNSNAENASVGVEEK